MLQYEMWEIKQQESSYMNLLKDHPVARSTIVGLNSSFPNQSW